MIKVISGWVTYYHPSWNPEPIWGFQTYEPSVGGETIRVQHHTFEVDVPDDWSPNPEKIEMLCKLRKELNLQHAEKMLEIETEIANLLALPAPER